MSKIDGHKKRIWAAANFSQNTRNREMQIVLTFSFFVALCGLNAYL